MSTLSKQTIADILDNSDVTLKLCIYHYPGPFVDFFKESISYQDRIVKMCLGILDEGFDRHNVDGYGTSIVDVRIKDALGKAANLKRPCSFLSRASKKDTSFKSHLLTEADIASFKFSDLSQATFSRERETSNLFDLGTTLC